jgi:hypothetical protein
MNTRTRLTDNPPMVSVPTATLAGFPLRFAVAMAEGLAEEITWALSMMNPKRMCMWTDNYGSYAPDLDWEVGGPLIGQHKVAIRFSAEYEGGSAYWQAQIGSEPFESVEMWQEPQPIDANQFGDTALAAICRAVVFKVFGDTVSIPVELVEAAV